MPLEKTPSPKNVGLGFLFATISYSTVARFRARRRFGLYQIGLFE